MSEMNGGPDEARQVEDEWAWDLVEQFKHGDREAFRALYDRYFERVYAYMRVSLGSDQDAEDATQQVFVKVLESPGAYRRGAQPWRAWLFRIARNHAIDVLRRRGRLHLEEPERLEQRIEGPDAGPPVALGWTSDSELVLLIERLPELQRQVLTLRYVFALTPSEIAVVMERSPEAVRQLHRRAIRFLE